uniref:Uncharacterized protein n=1 Tax=Solanum lycopersicum TaxID=4081 RepID=A0A3Q7I7Q7_SOLLC
MVFLRKSFDLYAILDSLVYSFAGVCFAVEFLMNGKGLVGVSGDGCENLLVGLSNGKNDVKCDLDENKLRGTALIHLLFIVHVIVVIVMSFGLFAFLNRDKRMRCGDTSGPLLAQVSIQKYSDLKIKGSYLSPLYFVAHLEKIPKETNPPFVLKSSIASPLSSGGGIGDQMQWGALAHAFDKGVVGSIDERSSKPLPCGILPKLSRICNVKDELRPGMLETESGLLLISSSKDLPLDKPCLLCHELQS